MNPSEEALLTIAEEIRALREAVETLTDRISEACGLWQIRRETPPIEPSKVQETSQEDENGLRTVR